jgi:Phosphotransferase enzyme family
MDELGAQLTPAWLTEVLQAHGHLADGHVLQIHSVRRVDYLHSWHVYFSARYASAPVPTVPQHLFLKLAKPHALAAAQREAAFYARIAPHLAALPLVPCYGTGLTATGSPYVLLADLSPSHHTVADDLSHAHFEAMVAVLAQLHAACWEQHDLLTLLDEQPDDTVAAMCPDPDEQYADLLAHLGDALSAEQWRVLQRYLTTAPALFRAHLRQGAAVTLCHPDNIATNFLFPRQAGAPVYLIDWHVYRAWWGPVDLAALLTRPGPAEPQLRDTLLRSYHTHLLEYGVTNYAWEACQQDYRLGVIDTLRVVFNIRHHPRLALQNLAGILPEFQRQGCWELLG